MNANEITTHRNKTREEIDAQAERLMQANETWYSDAIRAGREPKNRKAQIIAAWHNTKQAAKEDRTPAQPTAKRITVKRSEWSETAKRLECSGWYYIGTPTATGKTIYRRGNSEVEIIIEEDSPAPEFSELSHAATNIVLTAENDGNIYRCRVLPLILSLVNKIKRGIKPDRKRLAQSAAMRAIIADSLSEMYCAGWMENNTKVKATERKEAANYLAWSYISDAEDEYSNQMAAYK